MVKGTDVLMSLANGALCALIVVLMVWQLIDAATR
jgi:uncharacterized membrane protein